MQNFEGFLAEKHAAGYIGPKDGMADHFDRWIEELDCGELIDMADQYARALLERCEHQDVYILNLEHQLLKMRKGKTA